jgi:Protein of unknown function (DUF3429)
MSPFSSIPSAARWLGFGGLLPFAGAVLARFTPAHDLAPFALSAYGAVILSFLGGVRWGLAIADTGGGDLAARLSISVLPALAGWVALLLPPHQGLSLLAVGFVLMLLADLRLPAAPLWYRGLRVPLSAGAVCALLLGLTA